MNNIESEAEVDKCSENLSSDEYFVASEQSDDCLTEDQSMNIDDIKNNEKENEN